VEEVSATVLEAEIAKQLRPPLTSQQRAWLVAELFRYGWTPVELTTRMRSVVSQDTYGTIALQYWIADLVMTPEDARLYLTRERNAIAEKVERIIAERTERVLSDVEAAKAEDASIVRLLAAQRARLEFYTAREQRIKELAEKEKQRLKDARRRIRAMSLPERRRLLDDAVREGLLHGYDNAIVEHAYLFADKLIEVLDTNKKER
jgi:hypothetical protein